jgi:hypothetical protein
MMDIFDDVIIFCMETSINNGFGNVTGEDDIPDLEAPTECGDKEKVSELKTSCASDARLSNKRHKDNDDDVEPSMNVNDIEVDYEFHNDAALVQVELSLEDEDVEEIKDLSQIRSTLQALNSLNMWIGDTGATRHSQSTSKMESTQDHQQVGPGESPVKQSSQAWKWIFQECIVTRTVTTSLQYNYEMLMSFPRVTTI